MGGVSGRDASMKQLGIATGLAGLLVTMIVLFNYASDAFNWKFVQDQDVIIGPMTDAEQDIAIREVQEAAIDTRIFFKDAYAAKLKLEEERDREAAVGRAVERNLLPRSASPGD